MRLFKIEHSVSAYRADFLIYGGAWLFLLIYLVLATPGAMRWSVMSLSIVGIAAWSLAEYPVHCFVLHGLRPFSHWHTAHHQHPAALICMPTVLRRAALMVSLVFLPALALADLWHACGLTFGMLSGYAAYTVTHHAMHHGRVGRVGRAERHWVQECRRWHAVHHAVGNGCYGVTSAFWDHVFRSGRMAPH